MQPRKSCSAAGSSACWTGRFPLPPALDAPRSPCPLTPAKTRECCSALFAQPWWRSTDDACVCCACVFTPWGLWVWEWPWGQGLSATLDRGACSSGREYSISGWLWVKETKWQQLFTSSTTFIKVCLFILLPRRTDTNFMSAWRAWGG